MEKARKQIWLIGGRDGYAIGDETLELLEEANDLRKRTDCFVSIIIFGTDIGETIQMLAGRRIADSLYVYERADYAHYDPAVYVSALKELAKEQPPDIILISASSMGRDLAPRLAYHLNGNLTSNIQQLNVAPDGTLKSVKPVYGGKVNAVYRLSGNPPHIVTLIPGVIGVSRKKGVKQTQIILKTTGSTPRDPLETGYTVTGFNKADPRTIDIIDADVVVAGGRGVAGTQGFKLLERFAFLIGGAVGCSRPIVDQGTLKLGRQIGQTGKTVKPELFLSCGISGAMQHEMGMKDSHYIIAVNSDEAAPVFRIADFKVIADINALLPELIQVLEGREPVKGPVMVKC